MPLPLKTTTTMLYRIRG